MIKTLLKFLGLYKGTFEVVYSISSVWNVRFIGDEQYNEQYNEYCHFDILYNEYTGKYVLKTKGYMPKNHDMYQKLFKYMRMLNDGMAYVKGGEIYVYKSEYSDKLNGKSIDEMNETECQAHLNIAIENENYELAEKIKQRLKDLKL